ncbi:MAG TPA: DinB family protein [Actinomycetota bacterium]|nr:DinB family protein [Actinomycetota bacterium]
MSIDFGRVRAREARLADLVADLSPEDLARATDASIAQIEEILAQATDHDVTFVPDDPIANDPAAADPAEQTLAWSLGHLVVHVTASAEESAALAAELARGVPFHGRSRWEVPWRTVTTIDQCRRRLEESRRIRLASLQMWPSSPPSEVDDDPATPTWAQAKERFVRGLSHEDAHLEQFRNVMHQARSARSAPNGGPGA